MVAGGGPALRSAGLSGSLAMSAAPSEMVPALATEDLHIG
jgi:hypothetical protein